MTVPNPNDPVTDPNLTYPTSNDLFDDAPRNPPRDEDTTKVSKAKAAALLAGATALAGKLRQEAPKKVHELQAKRAAGRCVILSEVEGRAVAVGPFRNPEAAQRVLSEQALEGRQVELLSAAAYVEATGSPAPSVNAH